ncbi:24801_t:CDS:2, partial [Cetraspora pellucida]
ANAPINADLKQTEIAKSIKFLSEKIVSMEKQISENSSQFSINIKNFDETVKHYIESVMLKIAVYSLIEQFRQAISLERCQSLNKPPPSSTFIF